MTKGDQAPDTIYWPADASVLHFTKRVNDTDIKYTRADWISVEDVKWLLRELTALVMEMDDDDQTEWADWRLSKITAIQSRLPTPPEDKT